MISKAVAQNAIELVRNHHLRDQRPEVKELVASDMEKELYADLTQATAILLLMLQEKAAKERTHGYGTQYDIAQILEDKIAEDGQVDFGSRPNLVAFIAGMKLVTPWTSIQVSTEARDKMHIVCFHVGGEASPIACIEHDRPYGEARLITSIPSQQVTVERVGGNASVAQPTGGPYQPVDDRDTPISRLMELANTRLIRAGYTRLTPPVVALGEVIESAGASHDFATSIRNVSNLDAKVRKIIGTWGNIPVVRKLLKILEWSP